MKGKLVVLILVLAAFAGFLISKKPTPQPTSQIAVSNGRYTPYTKAAFDGAKDKKRILYFHAPWCPICRPIDKEFQEKAGEIPEGVVVFKTDYDTSGDLKKKYGVTYQHTFVEVDAQGNQISIWNGGGLAEVKARYQ